MTQVFKCDLRLSAVTGHLIPRQTLVTTHVSSFSTKIFSLRSLWPHTPLRNMHILNIRGPWLRHVPFVFCCVVGTASVLAPAPTKTGGLHSLVGSWGHLPITRRHDPPVPLTKARTHLAHRPFSSHCLEQPSASAS